MMQEYDGASADLYSGAFAQDNNWPYFRYAEVLLNYAEAQNEALAAPDKSVYDAINEVRDRADQPGLPEGLSKDEMEEHRFFDLRRWKEAATLRAPIKGMTVEFDGNNNNYKIVTIEERVFNENNYYLPIPHSETEKNPNVLERN